MEVVKKRRLVFFCARLGGGGAEMQLVRVVNNANFSREEIHLVLSRDQGIYEPFLDARIRVHYLSTKMKSSTKAWLLAAIKLPRLLRKIRPDIVVSFMDAQNVVALLRRIPGIRYVICCQNAPRKSLADEGIRGRIIHWLMPRLYPESDRIIAICRGVEKALREDLNITGAYRMVYNAGFDDKSKKKLEEKLPETINVHPHLQLVAVGRLTKQKGFDFLLKALSRVRRPFSLWLLGAGKEETSLKQLCVDLGLESKVKFLGFQTNPFPFYRAADVFVLSSRWEGFGNVITEAMISGTAVVATRCPFGPDEIITHEKDGLLVATENVAELSQAIERLADDPALRQKIRENGSQRALDFSADQISACYFEVLDEIHPNPFKNTTQLPA